MRGSVGIIFSALGGFIADDGWPISSNIALATLTSLFPFLIFVTALAGFLGSQDLSDEAARLIFGAWPKEVAGPIAGEVHNVLTAPRGGLLTFGAVLALYFSSSAIEALRIGLNRAYDCTEVRPWWLLRLQSIAFMAIASFALLALALLVVLGPLIWTSVIAVAPGLAPLQNLVTIARLGVATVALGVTLTLAHIWLPGRKLRLVDVAPGVIMTFVCSVGFGEIFGAYLSEFARNYVSTYAGLASVMIALVFLYSVAAIFVFGGELNAAIMRAREPEGRKSRWKPGQLAAQKQKKSPRPQGGG
jgi:membrane protein